jgi:succinate-acetate transporter protein
MSETPTTPAAVADPAPLGLAGFAATTLILSFINANVIKEGATGGYTVVLGMALAYGGLGQLLAGMWEFRRGNTFGATAFSSYGAFWLSYWWIVTHLGTGDVHQTLGLFLLAWCIITAYLTLAALRTSLATLAVFVFLTLTFLFLAIGSFQNGIPSPDAMTKVGGWLGIITAALAFYASAAAVVNTTHGKQLIPTWPR